MTEIELLKDLHIGGSRQGPGGDAETRQAIELWGLKHRKNLQIADIGCGTGASTLVLAEHLDAQITAIDFLSPFLDVLKINAERSGLSGKIKTISASMESLPFEDASLDAIWSEGAIYNIGFADGVKSWSRFLKKGSILAVSELTWLGTSRPNELTQHWMGEYPEVATASAKFGILEANGFTPIGYFPLEKRCWMENYYRPMQKRFDGFLARNPSDAANAIVDAEKAEIALYEKYSDYVSYGYYIARKDFAVEDR